MEADLGEEGSKSQPRGAATRGGPSPAPPRSPHRPGAAPRPRLPATSCGPRRHRRWWRTRTRRRPPPWAARRRAPAEAAGASASAEAAPRPRRNGGALSLGRRRRGGRTGARRWRGRGGGERRGRRPLRWGGKQRRGRAAPRIGAWGATDWGEGRNKRRVVRCAWERMDGDDLVADEGRQPASSCRGAPSRMPRTARLGQHVDP
jgi:hypothetical protein